MRTSKDEISYHLDEAIDSLKLVNDSPLVSVAIGMLQSARKLLVDGDIIDAEPTVRSSF